MKRAGVTGLLAFASAALACGGGQTQGAAFDAQWQSDNGVAIGELQKKLAGVRIAPGADVAVGVVGKDTLLGLGLGAGGGTWKFKHKLDARPVVAGGVVVGLGDGELFALDARTGAQIWKRAGGGSLRGAGDDGKTTVVTIGLASGGSAVLAVSRDGRVIRQIEDSSDIGVPAVVGDYVFLPWRGQYVTAFDVSDGSETARALLRTTTSRAFTVGGTLFFGEVAATRFDDRIRLGAADQASTVKLATRELPGSPAWMHPGADAPPLAAAAPDKLRLYARPTPTGPARVDSDRYAATYYRVALGFGANQGELAWAHLHGSDFVGGDAYAGGFALCDAAGKVTLLDARSGAVVGEASFGRPVDACVVQTDGLTKPSAPARAPLAEQIAACVTSPAAELATIQRFLLRELVVQKDESVTKTLVELVMNPRTSPFLAKDARAALAARRNGAGPMLAALEVHVDWLAGRKVGPPVAPLADALAGMKERRAAPLLVKHLLDPSTSAEDVQHAAAALAVLAGREELPALKTFFAMYRGSSGLEGQEAIDAATTSVAAALIRLGDGAAVVSASADASTAPGVKSRLAGLKKTP